MLDSLSSTRVCIFRMGKLLPALRGKAGLPRHARNEQMNVSGQKTVAVHRTSELSKENG